jgi:outer membrane protein OmpA-like peptidoglycan-associated protein
MNTKIEFKGSNDHKSKINFLLVLGLGVSSVCSKLFAQSPVVVDSLMFTTPSWWFGGAVGANGNFYQGSTQQLTGSMLVPTAFHNGNGIGLYGAPLVEFHAPNSKWGVMLQVGYDNRAAKFEEVISPCDCPLDLKANLSYITIEPSLRFAPFKSNFYLFGGPRMGVNIGKSFVYSQKNDPGSIDQTPIPDVAGDFSDVNKNIYSMQVGAGYDVYLTDQKKRSQFIVSPFVSFQPYFGQDPRSIETWNMTTVRVGAAFKFGRGKAVLSAKPENYTAELPPVTFVVQSPPNIASEHRVHEVFPLRNYVFFDLGSTEIPERYVLLSKDEVKNFKAEQLDFIIPKRLSGRSSRQLIVYYNILNILGDRMGNDPNAKITLVGASDVGVENALLMTKSIRNYLHDVFGIDTSRIAIKGSLKPELPSMYEGVMREIDLHKEGDRRVSIESNSPGMLMEFQTGPDAPLKPIELTSLQIAPVDSYIGFDNQGATEAFSSWSLEVLGKDGEVQTFGPYNKEKVTIPGKMILGNRAQGDYKVTMVGQAFGGGVVKRDTMVHMVLWTPPKGELAMRYSVLYGFNESKTIAMYEKYLLDVVVPKVPMGATVMIHGYTDVLGEDDYNLNLSTNRANDVCSIFKAGLAKVGRTDVIFKVYGFGEDPSLMPFENGTPEERFYNRTVIIDIISKK